MPLRMLLDSGTIAPEDTVLVGARSLDAPEETFIAESGLRLDYEGIGPALEGADAVYVAFDCDVLEPDQEVVPFMPEPGGRARRQRPRPWSESPLQNRSRGWD